MVVNVLVMVMTDIFGGVVGDAMVEGMEVGDAVLVTVMFVETVETGTLDLLAVVRVGRPIFFWLRAILERTLACYCWTCLGMGPNLMRMSWKVWRRKRRRFLVDR